MTRTKESDNKNDSAKTLYFVPGIGEIKADDLVDLEKQVKKLKEKEEGR